MTYAEAHIDETAVSRLLAGIRADIDRELYDGAVIALAHKGQLVVHEALGFSERDSGRVARVEDVFRVLSLTKAFTVTTVFQAIEEGLLQLTTKVADVIPEFRSTDRFRNKYRDRIDVSHLLTHRASMPPTPEPLPMRELGNLTNVVEAICGMDPIGPPGTVIDYAPAINHALMAEMVRRVRGAETYREIVSGGLWEPLGMKDTALGAPRAWADRIVPLKARFGASGWLSANDIEGLNDAVDEDAEMPWVGSVTTAYDVLRFAEMLRRGGELNGVRIVSPAILQRALQNHTGDQPNNWWIPMAQRRNWELMPANLGLGFFLRGSGLHPSMLGTLSSPGTFGNYGAGSSLYWVDPARELTMVCLTAGVLEESENIARFQKVSDLAVSTVVSDDTYPAL